MLQAQVKIKKEKESKFSKVEAMANAANMPGASSNVSMTARVLRVQHDNENFAQRQAVRVQILLLLKDNKDLDQR